MTTSATAPTTILDLIDSVDLIQKHFAKLCFSYGVIMTKFHCEQNYQIFDDHQLKILLEYTQTFTQVLIQLNNKMNDSK